MILCWKESQSKRAVKESEMRAYKHEGFWQCMDTQRDKELLEKMWSKNIAPWKVL